MSSEKRNKLSEITQEWLQKYVTSIYRDIDERFPTDPETIEKKVSEFIEYGKQMLKGLTIAYLK